MRQSAPAAETIQDAISRVAKTEFTGGDVEIQLRAIGLLKAAKEEIEKTTGMIEHCLPVPEMIVLISDDGDWFDETKATVFCEEMVPTADGTSLISNATGTTDNHETLYLTECGRWVHCHWNDIDLKLHYKIYGYEAAAKWLLKTAAELSRIPAKYREGIEDEIVSKKLA